MRDENALRRPDFLGGIPIRFADDQAWTLPEPPPGAPGEKRFLDNGTGLGPDYEAAVAAVLEAEDEPERLRAELALTILLLGRNYNLAPEDFQALLTFPRSSPA